MIVYLAKKHEFLADVDSNQIEQRIHAEYRRSNNNATVSASEISSWKNSMQYMQRILADGAIPSDSGIAIEFTIPPHRKRIDFIVTGRNETNQETAVIIELKQWESVERTNKDGVVKTWLGGAIVERPHPSYQAWSYAALLEDYNEAVRDPAVALKPCAYLHNCGAADVVRHDFYKTHVEKAPAFLKADAEKLRSFIKQFVRHGDGGKVLYRIRDGKISPSKNLADHLLSLLKGNREFLMIDDQKVVYETAMTFAEEATPTNKKVLIVEGGPGTGKSVVAINLLVSLTERHKVAQYVTKNAAPRGVYESKLCGSFTKSRISNLFVGSGQYTKVSPNTIDALIVDEAHRLNEKSGLYMNLGENQVKEIIASANFAVFFLDEAQRVTLRDIGSVAEISRWAAAAGANIIHMELTSQFRCNGSNGYLAWLDHTLQIRETANPTFEGIDYDFAVCDSPTELRDRILKANEGKNKSRMVAGYCWDWVSKKDRKAFDIRIPEFNFTAKWNLASDGSLWIVKPETVSEVGCIHTCQGLELEYVGVIVGPDFIVRNGQVQTDAGKRSSKDSSIKGYKTLLRNDRQSAQKNAAEIIKNTYRTLMTRGQKGCFVYSVDPETNAYLKAAAARDKTIQISPPAKYPGLPLRILADSEVRPYINAVPLYDLQAAAGGFSAEQAVGDHVWVELPDAFTPREDLFVTRVVGESMNRRIPNGSWCLFKRTPAGSRDGKVVLVELLDKKDPESGGRYTVKIYRSEKRAVDDSWEHARILLKPDSTNASFTDIILAADNVAEFKTIGEFVAVLGID